MTRNTIRGPPESLVFSNQSINKLKPSKIMKRKKPQAVRRRMLVVRTLDRLFFEEGNQRRDHKACWRSLVHPLFGICYSTFCNYRHAEDDLSDLKLNPHIEKGLRAMVESVLNRKGK